MRDPLELTERGERMFEPFLDLPPYDLSCERPLELLRDLGVDFFDLSVYSGAAGSAIPRSSFFVFALRGSTMSLMKSSSSLSELADDCFLVADLLDFLLILPVLGFLDAPFDDFFDLGFLASAVFWYTNYSAVMSSSELGLPRSPT